MLQYVTPETLTYSPSSQVGLGGFVLYNSLIVKWF